MAVNPCLRGARGLLLLAGLLSACAEDDRVSASCSLTATIAFEGREYEAVDSLPGLEAMEVEVGERLGTGERAACPGEKAERVQVYEVVGVPARRAIFSEPVFGLMGRWNEDGTLG